MFSTRYTYNNPVLLGQGSESRVYSYTEDAVVRIYKHTASVEHLNELNAIYAFLSSHNLPFDIPWLYEVRKKEGVVFQIEKRLVGKSPALVYEQLDERQRQRLLLNFLEAADSFKAVVMDTRDYGQIMADAENTKHWALSINGTKNNAKEIVLAM